METWYTLQSRRYQSESQLHDDSIFTILLLDCGWEGALGLAQESSIEKAWLHNTPPCQKHAFRSSTFVELAWVLILMGCRHRIASQKETLWPSWIGATQPYPTFQLLIHKPFDPLTESSVSIEAGNTMGNKEMAEKRNKYFASVFTEDDTNTLLKIGVEWMWS